MFKGNIIPRWFIFLIDVFLAIFSVFLSFNLRFNFSIPEKVLAFFYMVIPVVLVVRIVSFLVFRTNAGIIRYTSTEDAKRIFVTIITGSITFCFVNVVSYYFAGKYLIPFSILIIDFILVIFLMTAFRLIVKILYQDLTNLNMEKTNVIIYGAGEAGMTTKRTLERDLGTKYKIIAFVDDDPNLLKMKIEGITIYETKSELDYLLKNNNIDFLIISILNINIERKQEIVEQCLKFGVKVLHVPPMAKWINGELSFNQIKKVKIEELLERSPIKLNKNVIRKQVAGKVILITGAAGSIGSEIARQLISFKPKKLILLDIAETPLYELDLELAEKYKLKEYEIVIGDIRNKQRMRKVFETFNPSLVYHAAAYKHVPLMENNPSESILTNILGTKETAELAMEFNVDAFVLVSSDKAVNPTNVMGASKRIAEIFVQALNHHIAGKKDEGNTKFITTRFGNVLGSNGSVIPFFRKQIENGGPITVTHPDVTRFFMTIPEACQLVLEAGAIGNGGEIYIFDMGQSIKIVDLAKKMVKLSGLTLGKDIQLVFIGLRPGEKLFEELLNNEENTMPTHHPKIMIAKVREYEFSVISKEILELIELFDSQDNFKIVGRMKKIVPEFISKNSLFERLDVEQSV